MTRTHTLVLSLAIGLIAILGVFAATRTVGLGNQARSAADAQVAARSAALDKYAASLRTALARSVKPLPTVPAGSAAMPNAGARPVRIVYHRPPPIVIHTHRSGGDGVEGGELDD